MTEQQQFRSALNGYNREDVVHYLEFLNNKHNAQVAQLTNELEALRSRETPESDQAPDQQLTDAQAENETLRRQIAALEQRLEEAAAPAPQVAPAAPTDAELEAYRRAERVERVSRERAREVGRQTADALEKISDQVSQRFRELSDASAQMTEQLSQLQQAVSDSLLAIQEAAETAQALGAEEE